MVITCIHTRISHNHVYETHNWTVDQTECTPKCNIIDDTHEWTVDEPKYSLTLYTHMNGLLDMLSVTTQFMIHSLMDTPGLLYELSVCV